MAEKKYTYTRATVEKNIANYEQNKGRPVGGLSAKQVNQSLKYWKYILKRMGSKNEVTIPESTLTKQTYIK